MDGKLQSVIEDIEIMLGVNLGNGERRVLLDALGILTDMVPRVLTLDELIQAKGRWVWMERRFSGFSGKSYFVEPQYHVGQDDRGNQFFMDRASRPNECYGVEWRCWSAEPGEKQRRMTEWESSGGDRK